MEDLNNLGEKNNNEPHLEDVIYAVRYVFIIRHSTEFT